MVAVLVAKSSPQEASRSTPRKRRSWRSQKPAHFLLPRDQVLELVFFRRIFDRLRQQMGRPEDAELDVPLAVFQRVFVRLFRLIGTERAFDARDYDTNGDGSVEWAEFLDLWRRCSVHYELSVFERIHITLEDPNCCLLANLISKFVLIAILTSTMCFILATMPSFQQEGEALRNAHGEVVGWKEPTTMPALDHVETGCIIVFTIEYLVRLCTAWSARPELLNKTTLVEQICDDDPVTWSTPLTRTLAFLTNMANLVDLVSIVPFYVELILGNGPKALVVLRAVKLARVFRVVRVAKYGDAMSLVAKAMKSSTQVLWVLGFNVSLGVIVFSAIMYNIEGGRWNSEDRVFERRIGAIWEDDSWQDQWAATPFYSIPATFWWCFITCTTVGYGDEVPKSAGGQVTAVITALWGVIMLALPIGVVANNFTVIYHEQNEEKISNAQRSKTERAMLVASLSLCDQVSPRSQMIIEVYDDYDVKASEAERSMATSQELSNVKHDFLGSAVLDLVLPADQTVFKRGQLALQPDFNKSRRNVTGKITLEYEWRPRGSEDAVTPLRSEGNLRGGRQEVKRSLSMSSILSAPEETVELDGDLTVRVLRGENLLRLDWKPNSDVDPYCLVKVFRTNPDASGELIPDIWRTKSARGSAAAEWAEERRFSFEPCRSNAQIYKPDIHGSLDVTATYYAEHGSLVGYKEHLAAAELSPKFGGEKAEIRSLRNEMRDLRKTVETFIKSHGSRTPTGGRLPPDVTKGGGVNGDGGGRS